MPASSARIVALEVVSRVRERGAYAHETLDTVLKASGLVARDTAFATRLAYGTIAARGTLDEAVAKFVKQPASLEPGVADALAVAAYEILFARTPVRAAVSQGVELVRSVRPRAAGMANAVLRRLAESRDEFPWGDPASDVESLARLHAHPVWLTRLWVDELGWDAAAELMAANNEPAPLYLAHLPFKSKFDSVLAELEAAGAEPAPCSVEGCIVVGRPSAALSSGPVRRKEVLVADQAAQLTAAAVSLDSALRIVELGAGRGTKSILIAGHGARDDAAPQVVAVDTHGFKLDVLTRTAQAAGATGIVTVVADATGPDLVSIEGIPEARTVDAVLVDAPCTGMGTLRRHPDRRWRATPGEIESLAAIGSLLLASAARLVKPGGFVVYSTCTVVTAENERVIESFLLSEAGAGFSLTGLAGLAQGDLAKFVTPEGYFRSLPAVGGPDGHFIARLRYDG